VRAVRIVLGAILPLAVAAFLVITSFGPHRNAPTEPSTRPSPVSAGPRARCPHPNTARHYVGAVLYKPQSTTLPAFVKMTGVRPAMIQYYVEFGGSLDLTRAAAIYRHAAFPIVQIDPYHAAVRAIAQGAYDVYLRNQARAVSQFHCPIAISFGHEMNGTWYDWGSSHVRPKEFIAAWRHIWGVFASVGVPNAIWLWTVNRVSPPAATPVEAWWPGKQYVSWVGMDGYFRGSRTTFTRVFGQTLQEVRGITNDPVLITETSVSRKGRQTAQIRHLFTGALSAGVFGVVWFNVDASQAWTLDGRPPAVLTEFRHDADMFQHATG
jgi:mannan endo-1,4-beta-mannosidase